MGNHHFLTKSIYIFILTSFAVVALFGFSFMMHGSDGRMAGECPFLGAGISLCPQDALALIVHHVSAYQSFLNVSVDTGLTILIVVSLFLSACALLVIFLHLPTLGPPASVFVAYDPPLVDSYSRKITRWLSLFENSPSFS